MASKVTIELRPHDALALVGFLRGIINDGNYDVNEFASIHEAVNRLEGEVYSRITVAQINDAILELDVNMITGRVPKQYL